MTSDEDARVRPASTIVPSAATPPVAPRGAVPPRRWPGRRWLIVAVVLLLVVGTGTVLLIRRHSDRAAAPAPSTNQPVSQPAGSATASGTTGSASTTPSASTTQSASTPTPTPTPTSASASGSPAQPGLLAHGREAPASAVRWNQVDAGWSLRAWSSATNPNTLVSSTLYLVNPIGGRYRITTLPPNTALVAWSPDHRRAIVKVFESSGRSQYQEIALSTGQRLSRFRLAHGGLLSYAGPGGNELLLQYGNVADSPGVLEWLTTGGVHQRSVTDSGLPTGRLFDLPALHATDGSRVVVSDQRGLAVFGNDGALLRQVDNPAGGSCTAYSWWSEQEVLGTCSAKLARISLDTGRITRLAARTAPEYGYTAAWRVSGGTLIQEAASCGFGALAVLDGTGTAHPVRYRLPAGVTGQSRLLGVHADQALLVTGNCGTYSRSLFRLDLRSGRTTALLGAGVNGGTVLN